MAWGTEGVMAPNFFEIVVFSEILKLRRKTFRNFAIGKDVGVKFYRKIIELGLPTLQGP